MRRGLKVVGTMAEIDKHLPKLIDQLKPCYTSSNTVNSNVMNIQTNAEIADDQLIKIAGNLAAVIADLNALIQQKKAA